MEVHRLITHGTLDNEEDEGRFRTDNEVNVVDAIDDYIQRKINEKRNFVQFHRIGGVNERQATIIKWIFDDPDILLTVKEIEMRLGVSNQTARNDLMGLVNQGYLDTLDLNKKTKAFCKGSSFDVNLKKRLRSG